MKNVCTAEQMQEIEERTKNDYGISSAELMENAGEAICKILSKKFNNFSSKKILIFCGHGNNGGDGFVVARLLYNLGCQVNVCFLGNKTALKRDAATKFNLAWKRGINIITVNKKNINSVDCHFKDCDIIVDALYGTGLTRPVSGVSEEVINTINASKVFTVSIDMPSGVNADTGQVIGPHIYADLTLALSLLKLSHLLFPAAEAMGQLEILNINIPPEAVNSQSINVHIAEEEDIRSWIPKRLTDSHKGTYGHVLVIAGSKGKCGAAGLTALAALRAGCGLVTLAIPESCHRALEFRPLEVMTIPICETNSGSFSLAAKDALLSCCKDKSAVAIGPGISTEPETVQLLSELLPEIKCPLVIDADGINSLAKHPSIISKLKPNTVLTPHLKEFSRITGVETVKLRENKIEYTSRYSINHSVTIVLKGAASIIAQSNGKIMINPTGNSGMATAGSGDVLTGIISSLIAQGLTSSKAAIVGTYLHGLAGDIYAQAESETSLIAGDLLRTLPESIKRILK